MLIDKLPNIILAVATLATAIGSGLAAYWSRQGKDAAATAAKNAGDTLTQSKVNAASLSALRS